MKQDKTKAIQLSKIFRYIDDLFNVNNEEFGDYINTFYSSELELKDTSTSSTEVRYPDTRIKLGDNNPFFHFSIYDKRDDFTFWIVNFPRMDSNVPAKLACSRLRDSRVRWIEKAQHENKTGALHLHFLHFLFECQCI